MKRVTIPKLDGELKQIGTTEVLINDNWNTEDYNKVVQQFPGLPQGYVPELFDTTGRIEMKNFYDTRQKGAKKLKGLFIEITQIEYEHD